MRERQVEDFQVPRWNLRVARGRYAASRASQLSGIPERTLYDWARHEILNPDFDAVRPKLWSYRDLVFLRVLAWLRSKRMPRVEAGQRVFDLRKRLSAGGDVDLVRSDGVGLFLGDAVTDSETGLTALPGLTAFLDEFRLTAPIEVPELGRRELWGPNLVQPSAYTEISPKVMGGDPCIQNTRIPTSTVFALHQERALSAESIQALYPEVDVGKIRDAIALEQRLRRAA